MAPKRDRATFEQAAVALDSTLDELDANAPHYNEWLRRLVESVAVGHVIELGAGRGTFTLELLRTATHVVAVEPSSQGIAALIAATHGDDRVTAVHGYATDAARFAPFDGAVLSNVLEHIEDDEAALAELFSLVRPGGCVAVFSPAFELLMSEFDRSIGHVRRYSKRQLTDRFERAGFEIVKAGYVNMPGFLAWLIVARLLNKRPTRSGLIRFYDTTIVRLARWVESWVKAPFGQSVLVIGRVPAGSGAVGAAPETAD